MTINLDPSKFLKLTTGSDILHENTGTPLIYNEYVEVRKSILERYNDEQLRDLIDSGAVLYAESDDGLEDYQDPMVAWTRMFRDAPLQKNIYVSSNAGSDTNGNGTIRYPFKTIEAAITHVKNYYSLSSSNNAVIRVSAGEYLENKLEPPPFCSIWGHHYRTRIKAVNPEDDLIFSEGSHTIKGLLLTGVTASDKYLIRINTPVGRRVTLQDISFSDYEAAGTISNATYINSASGVTTVRVKQCDYGSIQNKLIYLDSNCRVVVRGSQVFDCSNATYLDANNNTSYSIYNVDIDSVSIGINHNCTGASDVSNMNLLGATIPYIKNNTNELILSNTTLSTPKAQFSTYDGFVGNFNDVVEGDTALRVLNELSVGTSSGGNESVFGEGDSYFIGMNVYTSDGTDTSTSEGNLTDVTTEAQSIDTNYFGFQGTGSNYCIYVSTDVQNTAFGSLDYARIMGLKISQITAAVETTEKSIVFESWNGTSWVEGSIMATQSSKFYVYGNDLFIRANNSEHLRFGRDLIVDNNVKKTIYGKERYHVRLRIKNAITTAPTFNQFKISNNRTEINSDGTITMHGLARYVVALSFQSNTFGETGGVTNANFQVGDPLTSIESPHDSWTHAMKNNQLNGPNDAIYANALIPEGCCTSCPLLVKIKYLVLNEGTSDDGLLKCSAYFARTVGVPVADRSGGIVPVSRDLAHTTPLDEGLAAVENLTIDLDYTGKVVTAPVAEYSVADYYPGDLMLFRIGFQDNGNNKKIAILGIDVEYLKWTLGSRL